MRLAELFANHGATVLGLCRMLLRNRTEAEDAVQQTFLSAYTSLLNGNEPRHPAAWLATIARNECRARIEERMRQPLGDAQAEPESTLPDPVAAAAARADLQALWQAIGELPRRQRKALLLRELSGLSYQELAEALAVSPPTVESLLFRARRDLRARLRPVTGSAASVAPLAAIREALGRVIGGMPDPSAGALAGLASASPIVAKVAAGLAVVAVAGGTVAAVERRAPATTPAPPHARPAAKPAPPARSPAVEAGVVTPRPDRIGPKAPVRRTAPVVVTPARPAAVHHQATPLSPAPAPALAPAPSAPPLPEEPAPVDAAPAPAAPPVEPAPAPAPAPVPATEPALLASDDSSTSGGGSDEGSGSTSSGPGSDGSSGSSAEGPGGGETSGSSGSSSGSGESSSGSSGSGSSGTSGSRDSGSRSGSDHSGHGGGGGPSGSGGGDD